MDFLSRKNLAFKKFVREKSRIGRVPILSFALDMGEKNRQKIDFLLSSD
jgi:ribosome-binding factor A